MMIIIRLIIIISFYYKDNKYLSSNCTLKLNKNNPKNIIMYYIRIEQIICK